MPPQHFEVGGKVPGCSLSLGSWAEISCRYQVAELRVVPRAGPLLFFLPGDSQAEFLSLSCVGGHGARMDLEMGREDVASSTLGL